MKNLIRVVLGLVALAAAALSFQSLLHLGELCGYGSLSFAYPLVLDLGAVASCAAWMHERNRQALAMTWVMLAVSVILNGTIHYLDSEGTHPSWVLVVLVAAVPPAVLGLVVHLAVGKPAATNVAPESELSGVQKRTPEPELTQTSSMGAPKKSVTSDDDSPVVTFDGAGKVADAHKKSDDVGSTDIVAELIEQGAGRRRVAKELGLSEHHARQLLASRNGSGE